MRRAPLSLLALLVFFGLPGSAGATNVRAFDILGVRLAITVTEVEALATAKGFAHIKRVAAPSFD